MERLEMTPEQGRQYIKLQVGVAKLMLELGTVETPEEYVDRCAALFEMLILGQLKMSTDSEIKNMRDQIHATLNKK